MPSGFIKTIKDIQRRDLILTPRLAKWTMNHGHIPVTEEMADLLKAILLDDSNSVRHSRFGASSRGDCKRQQVLKYLGYPGLATIDTRLNMIFMDGTWRHLRWQMMLLAAGLVTHVEAPFTWPEKRMGISIDALNEEEGWLFELKGAWKTPDEVPYKHLLQIHTYFYVTGYEQCVYLVEEKATQNTTEWVVKLNPMILEEVEAEIGELNSAVSSQTLPAPLPEATTGKAPCNKCPFQADCLTIEGWPDHTGQEVSPPKRTRHRKG